MTQKAANLRAISIVAVSILAFLSQSPEFSNLAPKWLFMVVGALSVGGATYRAWLDQSSSQVVKDDKDESKP